MKTFWIVLLVIVVLYLITGFVIAKKMQKDSVCDYGIQADGQGMARPCKHIEFKWLFIWPVVFTNKPS